MRVFLFADGGSRYRDARPSGLPSLRSKRPNGGFTERSSIAIALFTFRRSCPADNSRNVCVPTERDQ
jgi:hypothetical protein